MAISILQASSTLRGFSLIELLVVVSIMGVLLISIDPSYRIAESRSNQTAAVTEYAQALYRAQMLSQAARGDSPWGVVLSSTSTTLFEGATYATRNSAYDELYTFQQPLTISGATEVDFSKFSGTTTAATSTLTAPYTTGRTLTINAKGTINY